MSDVANRTPEDWRKIEAEEHDEHYAKSCPFGLDSYVFSVAHALWYEDYAYKRGRRRDRGHRTAMVFDLIDLDALHGKRVLDVGCGIGQYSVLFAKKGADVVGIDLSPVGIEIARKMAAANDVSERCRFVVGDVTQLVVEESSFDVVLLHEVYHHAIKYPGLKEKIHNVTKDGGKIILADTVRGSGMVNAGRRMVKYFRYFGQDDVRQHEENLGDVLFDVQEYERFAEGFSTHRIYLMSYLYMIKQTILQYHTDKVYVRLILRMAKYADDVLLTVMPSLRQGCGEAILYIEK